MMNMICLSLIQHLPSKHPTKGSPPKNPLQKTQPNIPAPKNPFQDEAWKHSLTPSRWTIRPIRQLHFLKLRVRTWKMDGWFRWVSFWGPAYFRGQTVKLPDCLKQPVSCQVMFSWISFNATFPRENTVDEANEWYNRWQTFKESGSLGKPLQV